MYKVISALLGNTMYSTSALTYCTVHCDLNRTNNTCSKTTDTVFY